MNRQSTMPFWIVIAASLCILPHNCHASNSAGNRVRRRLVENLNLDALIAAVDDLALSPVPFNDIGRNPSETLYLCEGDCDRDSDCAGELECFETSGESVVLGCEGTISSGVDYCYDKTGQGRYKRPAVALEAASPTQSPTPAPTYSPTEPMPPLVSIDSDVLELRDSQLLGMCEGDCDRDSDCEDGLICFQRSGSQRVPGCSGEGESGDDYCVDPNAKIQVRIKKGTFRLKMYWEDGYDWQESSREKWYCMECEGSCSSGNDVEIGHCDEDGDIEDSEDIWFLHRNMDDEGKSMFQLSGRDLCLALVSDSGDDTSSRVLELEECDDSESSQYFKPSRDDGQGWDNYRFEMVASNGKCISQEHHPKKNEDLYGTSCSTARGDDTSYWVKW